VRGLYPTIEPYAQGRLDMRDGNHVYWEECGNPSGIPVVVLHGGPGSGRSTGMRRFFDPELFRIILFDQRGCGRSTPHASEPTVDLSRNTTDHLLADLERLRDHLGVIRWVLFGVSWGSVLGLAYAERHHNRVTGLVLAGVAVGCHAEVDWLYRGVGELYPEAWQRFRDGVPESERAGDLVAAYRRLLEHPDAAVRAAAALRWTEWDWATSSVNPNRELEGSSADPSFQLARARICAHYFYNHAWLEDGVLLRRAWLLTGIPGVLVSGRLDVLSVAAAVDLNRAWPESELVIVEGAGHSTADPGIDEAIVAATDRIAHAGR
jgi:proline iminopeptidase